MMNETKKLLKGFFIVDNYTNTGQTREELVKFNFGDLADATFKKYYFEMVRENEPFMEQLLKFNNYRNNDFAEAYARMVKQGYPVCTRINQIEPFNNNSLLFVNLLNILHKPMMLAEMHGGKLDRLDLQKTLRETIFKNNEHVIFSTIINAESHDERWLNRNYLEGVIGKGDNNRWNESEEWNTFYRQLTLLIEGEQKTRFSEYNLIPSCYKGKDFHVEVINVEIEINRGKDTKVTFSLFGKVIDENEYQMMCFHSTDII